MVEQRGEFLCPLGLIGPYGRCDVMKEFRLYAIMAQLANNAGIKSGGIDSNYDVGLFNRDIVDGGAYARREVENIRQDFHETHHREFLIRKQACKPFRRHPVSADAKKFYFARRLPLERGHQMGAEQISRCFSGDDINF